MKVLYVIPAMYPFGWAYSARARGIANMISTHGDDITVFADYLSDGTDWASNNVAYDGKIRIVTVTGIYASQRTFVDKASVGLKTWPALDKYIAENPVDIIITSSSISKYSAVRKAAKKYKIPVVLEVCEWYSHKNWTFGYCDPRYIRFQYYWKRKYTTEKKAICISQLLQKHFEKHGSDTVRIPTIMDVSNKRSNIDRRMHTPIKLIFIGGITGGKDELRNIIEVVCCSKTHDFDVDIYGPSEMSIRALLRKNEIKDTVFSERIHMFGSIDQRKIADKLLDADFGVLIRPNRRSSNAGFPTKLGEYFAAGLPIIANMTGDIPLYVKNMENGVVMTDNSIESIQDALKTIKSLSDDQYLHMKLQARETAEKYFDYNGYIDDLYALIEK